MPKKNALSAELIKAEALRLGFAACGITPAHTVDVTNTNAYRQWLDNEYQANMSYMANNFEKRLDPCLLMEGTRSIVCVALNYYPAQLLTHDQYQFAWYAYGKDYHDIMKIKLAALQAFIKSTTPLPLQSRTFCDTAPVPERYWAWRAGLGWIGKNTQLILPHAGSAYFLGELFLDTDIDHYDHPLPNRCGACNRCLQACPTKALEAPYTLNSGLCLSYLTIEHRDSIPPAIAPKMRNKIYGCDECQRACPWNRFATPCSTLELQPTPAFMQMQKTDWQTLSEEQYRSLFKGSAVKRAKYSGLIRNIETAHANDNNESEKKEK